MDVWDVRALAAAVASSNLVIWGGGGLLQDHWQVPIEDLLLDARGGVPAHLRGATPRRAEGRPLHDVRPGRGPAVPPREPTRRGAGVRSALGDHRARPRLRPSAAGLRRHPGARRRHGRPGAGHGTRGACRRAYSVLGQAGLDLARRPRLVVAPRIAPDGSRAWIEPLVAALRTSVLDRGGAVAFVAFDHRPEGDEPHSVTSWPSLCGGAPSAVAVTPRLSAGECAGVLATADAVVATRLHALVLAAVAGTSAVALDYDPKIRAFAAELGGVVPTLPLAGLAALPLGEAISQALAEAEGRRAAVAEAVRALRTREAGNLQTALWLLGQAEKARPRTRQPDCTASGTTRS